MEKRPTQQKNFNCQIFEKMIFFIFFLMTKLHRFSTFLLRQHDDIFLYKNYIKHKLIGHRRASSRIFRTICIEHGQKYAYTLDTRDGSALSRGCIRQRSAASSHAGGENNASNSSYTRGLNHRCQRPSDLRLCRAHTVMHRGTEEQV